MRYPVSGPQKLGAVITWLQNQGASTITLGLRSDIDGTEGPRQPKCLVKDGRSVPLPIDADQNMLLHERMVQQIVSRLMD